MNAPNENTRIFTAEESRKITEALCAWIDEEGEDIGDILLDENGIPLDDEEVSE